jgi:hypothetical protein
MKLKLSQAISLNFSLKVLIPIEHYKCLSLETQGILHLQIKRRKQLQISVENLHYSINPQEIKTEIEGLEHTVTNIWNIKQYRTTLPLSLFL